MFVDEVTDTLQDDVTEFVQSAIASNGLTWMVLGVTIPKKENCTFRHNLDTFELIPVR